MNHYHNIIEQMNQGPLYLFTIVSGADTGQKMTWQKDSMWMENSRLKTFWETVAAQQDLSKCPYRFLAGDRILLVERLIQEPELVICGAGHVSLELAAMAEYLEYPYIVLDDRQEFANKERFPGAKETICCSFTEALRNRSYSSNAYYVIVTRGHIHDLDCLDLILQKPYGYVGMIGSRAKVKKAMDELTLRGYSQEILDQVHAPIGLPIGGQTPKEIAISIIGQIIQQKYGEKPSSYVGGDIKELLGQEREMVLAAIVDKRGSAPRGIGSRMLVDQNGIIAGTIGGGKIEYEAEQFAKQLVQGDQSVVKSYRLNNDTAASLGMWCGGEVDVLFEVL